MDNIEAFDLEFDDDEFFQDLENYQIASYQQAETQAKQESRDKDTAAATNSFKHDKLTLKNLNNASAEVEHAATDALLKDAEKTKSSTPITKHNYSKNASAAHSNSKAVNVHEVAGPDGDRQELKEGHGSR